MIPKPTKGTAWERAVAFSCQGVGSEGLRGWRRPGFVEVILERYERIGGVIRLGSSERLRMKERRSEEAIVEQLGC